MNASEEQTLSCYKHCARCLHWRQFAGIGKPLESQGLCDERPADNVYGKEIRNGDDDPCDRYICNVPPSMKCTNQTVRLREAIAQDGKPIYLGWRRTRSGYRLAISRDDFATWNVYAWYHMAMAQWELSTRF